MAVAQAFEEFGGRCFWRRRGVGGRESVIGHGNIVVQGVNVGGGLVEG